VLRTIYQTPCSSALSLLVLLSLAVGFASPRIPFVIQYANTPSPGAQACYFSVKSSTVGTFSAQHSEPSGKYLPPDTEIPEQSLLRQLAEYRIDHGGAPQTMTGGKGSCSFTANVADGCVVTVIKESGCGSFTFTRVGNN
jgi:hypothetical protein